MDNETDGLSKLREEQVRTLVTRVKQHVGIRAVIQYMAQRPNTGYETQIDKLWAAMKKAGVNVHRTDVMECFRMLDIPVIGSFYLGRHGRVTRYWWKVQRPLFAGALLKAAGLSPGEDEQAPDSDEAVAMGADTAESQGVIQIQMIRHSFVLRPNLTLELALPSDLSNSEATRLSHFIQAVPFSSAAN